MDPLDRAQVLLHCDLCQTAALQSHCTLCQINLCKACVWEHLSDSSKRHNVVPYKHRKSATYNYPKCPNHSQNQSELYCDQCDIPVCSTCISSGKHKGHHLSDVLQKISSKIKDMEKELKELDTKLFRKYEEIASDIKTKKENLDTHYRKLTAAVTKQGEDWHREINIIVNNKISEIDVMKTKHLAVLYKQENEMKQIASDVKQSIVDLKNILESNEVSLTSAYKSRNAEFRRLPPDLNISLPSFSPHQINTVQLNQMFGSLSALSITKEEFSYTVKSLLDEPELITIISTGYEFLHSVICLSDEEIWTHGHDKIMKLYNLKGKRLKSIKTKSGNEPRDIAVTRSGDLVYTDPNTRTVNIVKNKQIQEVIKLQGWIPLNVCSISSGDLLVTMTSDDGTQSKVVRYSGSTEIQTIHFDSEGKPMYSFGSITYISENRNLDVCVADYAASAVVVVNQAGKFRFTYDGHPSTNKKKYTFNPVGITTDSQSQILTADFDNNCIHILDQDGQFLSYIDNCDLQRPWGLCVDTRDNLFVTEWKSSKVKKIRYM
ncbi:E3 ubiquitin-protein ligase Trim36-like [Saccostrea cucullata]|uniref:E3 ubiquitin-protein ligase Trim36-like n=1 Tax=Saccostrea cuccullata TaxID=36930 RepID=UPI002ED0F2BB